jgi:hypothetical protein
MKYLVLYQGSPIAGFPTLTSAYIFLGNEFKRRFPRALWGYQEAAAHGLTVEGTPELTPEQAQEVRRALETNDRDLDPTPEPRKLTGPRGR